MGEPRTPDEARVSRIARIVEVPPDHPVFSVLLHDSTATRRSPASDRSWPDARGKRAGFVSHLRTILDDAGRPMVFINWNTDMGDGWEWSNVDEYPGYLKFTTMAYRMAINEIVYSLTH